jgi:hypothetical protein
MNKSQAEAVHLDHALQGIDINSLLEKDFDPKKFLHQSLRDIPEEKLRKIAVEMLKIFQNVETRVQNAFKKIQRISSVKNEKEEFISKCIDEMEASGSIDAEIFDALKEIGQSP